MTIGIDARMLGKGFGLGRYIEELLKQLDALDTDDTFVVFVLPLYKTIFVPNHTERFTFVEVKIPWYSFREQVSYPLIIRSQKVDLMHFPHFNVPLLYVGTFIVTIHDLTMFHFPRPEATTRSKVVFWLKDKAHRLVIRSAARRAKHIITPSEYVRRDVHETLHIPLEKITTVYQAPFAKHMHHEAYDTHIDRPYLLYVGAAYPHKNIEGLLDAWERYVEEYSGEEALILIGKEDYFWNRLKPLIATLPNVQYIGFQTDEQLEVWYKNARAFVFPSLSEGFGIPPLEAMQYGIPVLSSSASCLPEILGEGAVYADTLNAEMFSAMIDMILHSDDVRYDLRIAQKEVLRRYRSDQFGKQTLALYTTVTQ